MISGCHDFNKAYYKCLSCNVYQVQGPKEFLKVRAWPASSSIFTLERMNTVIDISLLRRYDATTKTSPETSRKAFLKSVVLEGQEWGNYTVDTIGEVAFERAYVEFTYLQDCVQSEYGKVPRHVCPAEGSQYRVCAHVQARGCRCGGVYACAGTGLQVWGCVRMCRNRAAGVGICVHVQARGCRCRGVRACGGTGLPRCGGVCACPGARLWM